MGSRLLSMNQVTLIGIDYITHPSVARQLAEAGQIRPLAEDRVICLLKAQAKNVYSQQKFTSFFHERVCEGNNVLAYFICATQCQGLSETTSPDGSSPSENAGAHKGRKDSHGASRGHQRGKFTIPAREAVQPAELTKLENTILLPLGYWDSVYYATIAEIRSMYIELQRRFGRDFDYGDTVLHSYGVDGDAKWPLTAKAQATFLEAAWETLMDPRLIATLDLAVRMKKMHIAAKSPDSEPVDVHSFSFSGLINTGEMAPDAIVNLLWERHAPELAKACAALPAFSGQGCVQHPTAIQTPELSTTATQSFAQTQSNAYASILPSQNPFTQSFPSAVPSESIRTPPAQVTKSLGTATSCNPRIAEDNDFMDWNTSQADLLAFIPSPPNMHQRSSETSNDSFPPLERQPTGNRPFTRVFEDLIPDPQQREYAKTAQREAYQKPELPLPDFIAPRPAKVQRYVSAGGDLPLSQRPEIMGFDPRPLEPGVTVSKEEFERQIAAAQHLAGLARAQQARTRSGGSASSPQSKRTSAEGAAKAGEMKRDRTSSSASKWREGVKRVFSRKNSEGE